MTETILLVGGGGREHALARALAADLDEGQDRDLYGCATNHNPGIARLAEGVQTLDETDPDAVVGYAETVGATLAVVGPEGPLEAGVVDDLDDAGVYAFGPRRADARIETDKAFQRRFMTEHDVPGCPDFAVFEDPTAACAYVEDADGDLAVKPAGLTGGKGVRVTGDQITHAEAKGYVRELLDDHDRVVLEERLVGEEFTVQAFVANGDVRPTPAVQDHKRAYEGDEGPNTGGMGSYSDAGRELPFLRPTEYDTAVESIKAVVDAMPGYRGVLYGQFMLTAEGPKVVEFNARLGDPEAMNVLPVTQTDLLRVLVAAREGDPLPTLSFAPEATVCKYAVPTGYPTNPDPGALVTVDEDRVARVASHHAEEASGLRDANLFYASVEDREDGVYATTSRSFAVVGRADTVANAEAVAADALGDVGEGFRVRTDVGTEASVRRRVERVRELRGESVTHD
jgi:phosphoribosylamine--glycine ligase